MLLHNKDAWQTIFKPNVIFIFSFCTKSTGSQEKNWNKSKGKTCNYLQHGQREKKESRIHLPIWILKTLIKHCALIYFDIFHISQRCSTFVHFTLSLTFPKKTGFVKESRSQLSTSMTKKNFHKLLGNWMHGWTGWACVCVCMCVCVCVSNQAGSLRYFQVNFEIEFSCFNIIGHCQIVFSLPHLCLNPKRTNVK